MRLIDADALTISTAVPLDGKPYQYVHIDNIKAAPLVDAVPVVRCGECVMWKKYEKTAVYGYCRNKRFFAFEYGFETEENFTCADGERKGGNE